MPARSAPAQGSPQVKRSGTGKGKRAAAENAAERSFDFFLVTSALPVSHKLAEVLQRKHYLAAFSGVPIDHTFVICTLSSMVPSHWVHPALGGTRPKDGSSQQVCLQRPVTQGSLHSWTQSWEHRRL